MTCSHSLLANQTGAVDRLEFFGHAPTPVAHGMLHCLLQRVTVLRPATHTYAFARVRSALHLAKPKHRLDWQTDITFVKAALVH